MSDGIHKFKLAHGMEVSEGILISVHIYTALDMCFLVYLLWSSDIYVAGKVVVEVFLYTDAYHLSLNERERTQP